MKSLYSELEWLPRAPEDFSARVKALLSVEGKAGSEFQSLALHALDLNQLTKLAKALVKARSEGKSLEPLTQFRLAVLSNSYMAAIRSLRTAAICCGSPPITASDLVRQL